jgi:enoyl-CoA hydratase/carnithine racemase
MSLIQNKAVQLVRIAPGAFTILFDNPPSNIVTSEVFAGLQAVRAFAEDPANEVRVLLFESRNPDFFINHVDITPDALTQNDQGVEHVISEPTDIVEGAASFVSWLANAPFVSMAIVSGRTRGFGCELTLGMDMRFASREKARLCLLEVGFGGIPSGGGIESAQLLAGRARAMEFIISADDFDGELAERYGLVNRTLPDAELHDFVYRLARRIASFSPASITSVKSCLNRQQPVHTLESLAETGLEGIRFLESPELHAISARLIAKAGGLPFSYEVELELPSVYAVD